MQKKKSTHSKIVNAALLAIMVFVISISLIHSASAKPVLSISDYEADNGNLKASTDSFDLDIELMNSGDSCAIDATVTAQIAPPFIIDDTATTDSAKICNGDKKTVSIPLKLESGTVSGSYPMTLTINYNDDSGNHYSFTTAINIFIGGKSDLNAHIINSNPLKIYPGDTATISVLIENDGTLETQSIKGQLTANYPITVNPSQSFFSIGTLLPKQNAVEQFSIEIPKDASAQDYPMTLELTYTEDRNSQTKSIPLTLSVEKKASFESSPAKENIFYPNSLSQVLMLNIKNTGTDTARDIKIQVQPQFPFTTDGSIRYISSLSPGESEPVEFVINIDKAAAQGSYSLDLIFDYKDSQGDLLQDTANAKATVENESFARIVFVKYWYLWLVLEIILIIVLVRTAGKKRKK